MKKQKLPTGYTEEQIRVIAGHYEHQSEGKAEAEIKAALRRPQNDLHPGPRGFGSPGAGDPRQRPNGARPGPKAEVVFSRNWAEDAC